MVDLGCTIILQYKFCMMQSRPTHGAHKIRILEVSIMTPDIVQVKVWFSAQYTSGPP